MNRLKVPEKRSVASRVATLVLILATSGCSSESPESVLTAFMDALIANDVQAAYSLLSDEDRAAMSWSEWANSEPMGSGWRGIGYQSFDISRIEQVGDTAEETLQIEVFDGEAYLVNFIPVEEALNAAVTAADSMAVLATWDMTPTVMRTETVHLRREASGWRVHLNLTPLALERDRNEARDLEILRAGLAALGDSTPGPN